jgi:hypothetical protein
MLDAEEVQPGLAIHAARASSRIGRSRTTCSSRDRHGASGHPPLAKPGITQLRARLITLPARNNQRFFSIGQKIAESQKRVDGVADFAIDQMPAARDIVGKTPVTKRAAEEAYYSSSFTHARRHRPDSLNAGRVGHLDRHRSFVAGPHSSGWAIGSHLLDTITLL